MTHLTLTHPIRADLPLRQAQADELSREAVANITAEIGVDRQPLVHTETRELTRTVRGRVSAPRRARNDTSTSDWRQALANYVDTLEAHVDEFQGEGYTLQDDQLGTSKSAIIESVAWELDRGAPYDINFDATVRIGEGVFETQAIDKRDPTVNAAIDPYLVIDGVACPGMRLYRKETRVGFQTKAIFDRSSAENNDIVPQSGVTETIMFEGTHTGDRATREAADKDLANLLATQNPVTCETKFPGYDLNGYVTAYNSNLEARFGDGRHDYRLEFTVGQRA